MMKKTALLLIIILVGCATTEIDAVDPWVGASTDKLRTTWGTPLKIEDDGTGGQILTYKVGAFYVDSFGTIYQTKTNYERPPKPPIEGKWVGKSVKELIADKGSPDVTLDDGKGGKILRYSYHGISTITIPATPEKRSYSSGPRGYYKDGRYIPIPQTPTRYTQPRTITRSSNYHIENIYYINSSGIIYKTN